MLIYRTSREDGTVTEVSLRYATEAVRRATGHSEGYAETIATQLEEGKQFHTSFAIYASEPEPLDDEDEVEDEDVGLNIPGTVPCGACGGEAQLLGVLGAIAHYRCRDCGAESHSIEG